MIPVFWIMLSFETFPNFQAEYILQMLGMV